MSPWSASHPPCVKWKVWWTNCLSEGVSNVLTEGPNLSLYGWVWYLIESHIHLCTSKDTLWPEIKTVGLPHKYFSFQLYKICLSLYYIHMPSCLPSPYSSRRTWNNGWYLQTRPTKLPKTRDKIYCFQTLWICLLWQYPGYVSWGHMQRCVSW